MPDVRSFTHSQTDAPNTTWGLFGYFYFYYGCHMASPGLAADG